MTGDELVTLITEAPSFVDALRIARSAPAQARRDAADLLYVEAAGHDRPWVCNAIVREARA